ncbi:MAG: GC-type dockerin domain-anchored protein [Phycisphaerales bacterium]
MNFLNTFTTPKAIGALILVATGALNQTTLAQSTFNYLQWFETEWDDIERRTPDVFLAGYNALWLPPPSKASFGSVGYDPFDRFDLGQPPLLTFSPSRARTTYGTEATFQAMIQELQRSGAEVYIDGIFNHNGGRTTSDAFLANGGYPGFWIPREDPPRDKLPTDDWGDFHNGNAFGYLQSENPGASNYNLTEGDLVALVDIAQESNNQFIRHPVEAGNPLNIPAGTIFNTPDPSNARLYTDQALAPFTVNNPGTSRNPGSLSFTRYPYNTADPMAGDAVTDNGTGLLMRWAQWMIEVQGVDGFRLDALKHTPSWFWDGFFDSAIHQLRERPDGNTVNPFTFGENVTGNFDILNNFTRKDSFANRDALDLQGASRLRDLLNANGLGSWSNITSNIDSSHLDLADDGLINGSLGLNHVFSHDNGSVGNGGSLPPIPTAQQQGYQMHAYMLMRPGRAIVYHNGRAIFARNNGFFPREGVPVALGWNPVTQELDDTITKLVKIRNQVGVGQYFTLNTNVNDVLVSERAFNNQANSVTAVNDRFDAGFQSITVNTSYPQGTRIHELTGNAQDPIVDPNDDIPQTIVVGANGTITLNVPNNASSAGVHGKGYVIYAEALPDAELTIIGQDGVIEPDPANFPDWIQRLTEISVVQDDSFEIRVQTAAGDPLDTNTDDNALFTFNNRTQDWNGNGVTDIPTTSLSFGGYEQFVTVNNPLFNSGNSFGLYRQEIDATQMEEGMNYLTVVVFRHRPSNTSGLLTELRKVIYVDRLPPEVELVQAGQTLDDDRPQFIVNALDRTTSDLHLLLDVPEGVDPLTLIDSSNRVSPYDRFEYRYTFDGPLSPGERKVTMVAIEETGTTNVITETVTIAGEVCLADLTSDGSLNFLDVSLFLTAFGNQDPAADFTNDGQFNFLDVSSFLSAFGTGCP